MMFTFVGLIIVGYFVGKITLTINDMTNEYEEKINDGWIDCRSNVAFKA